MSGGPELVVAGRVGSLVLVEVAGTGNGTPSRVQTLAVNPPTAARPLTLTVEVSNPTGSHQRPSGTALILRDRTPIGHFDIPPVLLLPGQRASLEATWSGALAPGVYRLLLTMISANRADTVEREFRVE